MLFVRILYENRTFFLKNLIKSTYLSFNCLYHIFVLMLKNNKIPWKEIAIVGGVFVLYKAYELYRTGTELIVGLKSVKLSKLSVNPQGKIDSAEMEVRLSIFNISTGILSLRGVDVQIMAGGLEVSKIEIPAFSINRGDNIITVNIKLQGEQVFDILGKILLGDYPTFDINATVKIPFFTYKHKLKVQPSDYMTKEVQNLLSYLR